MGKFLGESTYWRESSQPLPSLLFIAPMIVVYELGVLTLGPHAPRNGADVWLRNALEAMGLAHHFLLPAMTCGLLLAWHHQLRERWRVNWSIVTGMAVESAVFGLLLLVVANTLSSLMNAAPDVAPMAPALVVGESNRVIGRMVGYLGAGIYEELLFRLLLLPPAVVVLQRVGLTRLWSIIWAGLATSVLFALAHYEVQFSLLSYQVQWPGEAMDLVTFAFRVLAGGFFTALFFLRGFGIAAGAHALYDIFVALF